MLASFSVSLAAGVSLSYWASKAKVPHIVVERIAGYILVAAFMMLGGALPLAA